MRKHLRSLLTAAGFLALGVSPLNPPFWESVAHAYSPGVPQTSTQLQARSPGLFDYDKQDQFVRDMAASMSSGGGIGATSLASAGAKCDGVTDDSAAATAAEATAEANGGGVFVPPGQTCIIRVSIDAKVPWFSVGDAPTLKWDTDLGAGQYAMILESGSVISLMDLKFLGPGGNGYPGVGVSPAGMDGVEIGKTNNTAPQAHLNSLSIYGFNKGLVLNTLYGHNLIDGHTLISNNYIGIDFKNSGGDFKLVGAEVAGNSLAGMAFENGSIAGGCYIGYTHLGFTPYGIIALPGATTTGLMDSCTFDEVHFESIGNSAFASETPPYSVINSNKWNHVGFMWDAPGLNGSNWTYTLGGAATPPTKTATCTPVNGTTAVSCSSNPITAGFGYTMKVTGSGIPNNTYIAGVTSGGITLSQNANSSPGAVTLTASYQRVPLELGGSDLEGKWEISTGTYPFMVGIGGVLVHWGWCGANGFAGKMVWNYDSAGKQYTAQIDGSQAFVNVLPQATNAPQMMTIDNDSANCLGNSRILSWSVPDSSLTIQGANVDPSYATVLSAAEADSWSTTTHNSGLNYFEVTVTNVSTITKDNLVCLVPSGLGNTVRASQNNPSWCVDLVGDVFDNASYVGTFAQPSFGGDVIRVAVDLTHNKVWYEVLYQGTVVGTGWDGNGTDNPATNTGGFGLTAATTWKVGMAVDPANTGFGDVHNGALAFNFQGPWAVGGGLPTGFSAWGGTLNPSDTAAQITLPAGSTSATTSFLIDSYAFIWYGIDQPLCSPLSDPGSRWWVSPLTPSNTNQMTAQVNVQSIPVNDVTFQCNWQRQ